MATPQLADIALCVVGCAVSVGVVRGYARGRLAADREAVLATDVGLPLETARTRDSVTRCVQTEGLAVWRAMAATFALGAVVALTPLGAERTYLLSLLPVLLVVRTIASATALRRPAVDDPAALGVAAAPRVADYLSAAARTAPAVAIVVAAGLLGLTVGMHGALTTSSALVLLVAVVAATVTRAGERRLLDGTRGAADPLALAWDDVLRARALAAGRSVVAQLAAVAAALALPLDSSFLTASAAIVGVLAVRSLYAPRPLPAALRPRSLAPSPEQDSEPA